MKNRQRRILTNAIIALTIYLAALGFFWSIGTRIAHHKTEALLEYATSNFRATWMCLIDSHLLLTARAVAASIAEPKPFNTQEVRKIAASYDVDELNVVGTDGCILASNDVRIIGKDMHISPKTQPYIALIDKSIDHYVEDFRHGANNPNVYRKYVGVPFPDCYGYVQIGFDESRLADSLQMMVHDFARDWQVGECGYYLCVKLPLDIICLPVAGHDSFEGSHARELGVDISDIMSAGVHRTVMCHVDGQKSFCRGEIYGGHLIIVVVPAAEFYGTRNKMMLTGSLVLFALIFGFSLLLERRQQDAEQIRELHVAEAARMNEDLALARDIQLNSLPTHFPLYPELQEQVDLFGMTKPARDVGGDFYDVFRIGLDRLAVVIADVSGKGIPAALFMMKAKATLKADLASGLDLAEAVSKANEKLTEGNSEMMFVTVWAGIFNFQTGILEYVNAGHNPPMMLVVSGVVTPLKDRSGLFMAVRDSIAYKKFALAMTPGDMLLLYTDGVTEASDGKETYYGASRLEKLMGSVIFETARDCCDKVLEDVERFANGTEQADDITLLAMKFLKAEKSFPATDSGLAAAAEFVNSVNGTPKVALIVDEIVSNIVRCSHAMTFSVGLTNHSLIITDDGIAFDPTSMPDPVLRNENGELKIGGLGHYIVRKIAASVEYERKDEHNVLTVTVKS